MVWAHPPGHTDSSLGASAPGGARPWFDLQTPGVDKASSLKLPCAAPDWELPFNQEEDSC